MKEKHTKKIRRKMGLEIEGTQQDEDEDNGVFYSQDTHIYN